MATSRETLAVGAKKCSHNVNLIAICKVGTLTEVGSGGWGVVFAQGPSTTDPELWSPHTAITEARVL